MKKLLLIFCCILVFTTKSQNGFTTYTTNLAITGSIKYQTAFLVDNSGNKWVGFKAFGGTGNAGLVKYDNTSWTLFNTTSTPALPSNTVTALAKDNFGNIWIGTNSGLVKYNGSTFTTYSAGLPPSPITCIEAVGSQIYVGTKAGLSRFDGVTFTNYNVANGLLPSDTVTCIKAETPGLIWLGGKDRMVEFIINGTFTSSTYINHNIPATAYNPSPNMMNASGNINCIYIDSQNAKWLGTTNAGILKYTGSTFDNANNL